LLGHEDVKEVVVIAKGEGENKYLCVFYVTKQGGKDIDGPQLQEYVSAKLPGYMVPTVYEALEAIPLNSNGKVDLNALTQFQISNFQYQKYIAPRDRVEVVLAGIWTGILAAKRESIGIDDNFFQMGGHSLKATTMVNRIYKEFQVDIEIADVFSEPTIRQMAQKIKKQNLREYSEIHPVAEQEHYQLSYAQRRLWILCQFEADSTAYNMPNTLMMEGEFDPEAFEGAGQALAERHEALRTVFVLVDGEPRQKVIKNFTFKLRQTDLRDQEKKEKEQQARQIYVNDANSVFDLEKGPLFFFRILRLEDKKNLLIFNTHHIVSDGWSHGIITNEVITIYNHILNGKTNPFTPLKLQYKDYTHWHNTRAKTGAFDESQRYWLEKFRDKPNGIQLPLDHPRKAIQTFNGGRVRFEIDEEKTARLQRLSLNEDATLFMTLLTNLSVFLYRYTGQEDILLGAPIANRKQPELFPIIGFMANTLIYRNRIKPENNFKQTLARVKEEALSSYRNQDYPFDLLVERLELDRDLSQSPLFNVMIAHNNTETMKHQLEMEGLKTTEYPFNEDFNMSKFDLTYFIEENNGAVTTRIEYNSDLFEENTIKRMAANYMTLLENVAAETREPVSMLGILTLEELETVVRTFNETENPFPVKTLREQFEDRVSREGDKTAVVYGKKKISYNQLNQKANSLAHYLIENYGAGRNDIIGISMERSIDMIAVIVGIIKAGAAYLAVDPNYPVERVNHVLSDSRVEQLVIDEMKPQLFGQYNGTIININQPAKTARAETGAVLDTGKTANLGVTNKPGDILYVNYTSGYTGTPNGAMLSHDCLTNLIQWQSKKTTIDSTLNCLQFTSINFCVSFQEIMGTLTAGGKLYLIGDLQRQEIDYLMEYLCANQIGLLYLPFSYLNFLFNETTRWSEAGIFNHSLKHIITAGEQLKITAGLKRFLDQNPQIQIHNHYGSTEMHVVTSYTLDATTAAQTPIPPAGKPISNVKIYILDPQLNPVPIGVYGELCVAGREAILGYIGNDELTARKQEHRPELSPVKLYRSGDIGRWKPDGNIELRGRKDHQVKIRGFRVEPGEVESKILSIEAVRECVVVVKDDEAGQKNLVAYAAAGEIDGWEIKDKLTEELPQYMIPKIILLEALPLMPNGKVDRAKLPEPQLNEEGLENIVPSTNDVEEKLVNIWATLLKVPRERIGIEDNFFQLGGHSLKATTLVNLVLKEFNVKVEIADVFTGPTIRKIAQKIKTLEPCEYSEIHPVPEQETYALSYAQRRLWILCQFEEESTAYNMPLIIQLTGPLDIEAFTQAVQTLAERHESLRTVFITEKGEPRQKIIAKLETTVEQIDIREMKEKEKEEKTTAVYIDEANTAFDLEKGPLFHFKLVRMEEEKYALIFNIHHIINDGWSQGIITNEIITLYNRYHRKETTQQPPLKHQYKDYSHWHNDLIHSGGFSKTQHYWQEKFKDKPNGIQLPQDRPRKTIQTFNGGRVHITIDAQRTARLHKLGLGEDATLFMSLLTLLSLFMYRYTAQEDIIIGAPIANRKRPELFSIIGFLVNTLIYRTRVKPEESYRQLLARVKKEALESYENQDYPFDVLVEQLELDRDMSQSPLFNVMIAHNNTENEKANREFEGMEISEFPLGTDFNMSKFDLTFFIDEVKDEVLTRIEFNSDLFNRSTIQRMGDNFLTLLDNVTTETHTPVSALGILSAAEYETVVRRFNETETPFPAKTLREMFEDRAEQEGEKTAVVYGEENISYNQLNKKANRLAHYLVETYQAKPNDIIGISMERSIDMIAVIVGIIKAGAAYLAVDPNYPVERVMHVLSDSRVERLVIDEMKPRLFDQYEGTIIDINQPVKIAGDEPGGVLDTGKTANPGITNKPGDILYVNYTSGSTGTPNGAMLSHECLTNLIQWQTTQTTIDNTQRCLQFTSINFCVSFQEIMGTLTAGGELYLIDEVQRQEIDYLMEYLCANQIGNLYLPFSYLNFLFNETTRWSETGTFNHNLKHIITAGEQLKITAGLKRFLDQNPQIQFHNHYGSTEMHVVTSYTLEAATAAQNPIPPAGKPISNIKIFILDHQLNP
ncbi:MAG: amino acid adenylation domain-containing protein, partial [bacterium]|nr:amino acid adenylation domain-containing protein [bacterium]